MDLKKPSPAPTRLQHGAHEAPNDYEPGDDCLAQAVRIPVRVVVLLVVVPVRMVWDVLVVCGRALRRVLLRPLGRALGWVVGRVLAPFGRGLGVVLLWLGGVLFYWPWVLLWRYVVVPVVRYGVVVPLVWVYGHLLTPLGRGVVWFVEHLIVVPSRWVVGRVLAPLGRGLGVVLLWLGGALFYWPWVLLWRYVVVPVVRYGVVVPLVWVYGYLLTPLGRGLVWLACRLRQGTVWLVGTALVTPSVLLYRYVLAPVGREIAVAVGVAWRVAGHVSRAVGRAVKWLAWNLAGRPASWFYRAVCTPAGHFVRDALLRPAVKAAAAAGHAAADVLASVRETVRQARREAWRALTGTPRQRRPVPGGPGRARNLGGGQQTQTVPGVAAEPEISLRKQG